MVVEIVVLLLASTVRLALPILIAALGETFAERSGMLNLGVEGGILMGALFAYVGSLYTGNAFVGLALGISAGMLTGLLFAYFTVTLSADQIVTGLVINIFALGLTTYIGHIIGMHQSVTSFSEFPIPVLSDIPILGPILFNQRLLAYVGMLLVPVFSIILFKTQFGLTVRAVGEDPLAAETVGIKVNRTRYISIILGGLMAGFAGAYLSLAFLSTFSEGMSSGRGFIAIAICILGNWSPYRILGAAILFGFIDALQIRIQALGLLGVWAFPFLLMLPYIFAAIALIGVAKKVSPPKALAKVYKGAEK